MKKYISSFLLLLFYFQIHGCIKQKQDSDQNTLSIIGEFHATWVRNFNPFSPQGVSRWATVSCIYEPLFIFNHATGKYTPWLATDYIWKNNNRVLEVSIRQNVKWSDASSFNANDVAFTFNLKKVYPALDTRNSWDYLKKVVAPNDSTVIFEFRRIYVPGFDDIAGQPIVPKHIWKDIPDPSKFPNESPVATGPYTEITRFESQIFELRKNNHYWQNGKPKIEKLKFVAYPGNEQATLALINGEVDWAGIYIPSIDRVYVEKDIKHHKYWFSKTGYSTMLYLNTKNQLFENVNIRKAISYAIDREQVVKVGMNNYTSPANVSGLSGKMEDWHHKDFDLSENWVRYDPVLSNNLFDEAGYLKDESGYRIKPDGSKLTLDIIIISGFSDWIRSAKVISQKLNDIGIQSQVKTFDYGAWISRMQKGEFEMAIGWSQKGANPYVFYRGLMSSKYVKPIGEVSDLNWHRFGLTQADSLFYEFENTSNKKETREIMYKIQNLFIEHAPCIPLFAEALWGECNTKKFVNFPSEKNPYAVLAPYSDSGNMIVLLNIKKRMPEDI